MTVEEIASRLKISKEEALDIWLTDRGLSVNEEQEELDKKAKNTGFRAESGKKISKKSHKVKVSAEKIELFNTILRNLDRCEGVSRENISILTENKLISVKIGDKTFKIDVIEQRK